MRMSQKRTRTVTIKPRTVTIKPRGAKSNGRKIKVRRKGS